MGFLCGVKSDSGNVDSICQVSWQLRPLQDFQYNG